ncbi:hypothetical protein MBOU_14380 [Mycobacterium bourgelatii]|uniref:Integrase n=1 Tax=Mycobacterium bourgelatii TaxID=1273442 RepID=A0A7I9YL32_MYCBU|nr:hypothetical protein MBOU_14380 [Mycobacterium bourgelatii]
MTNGLTNGQGSAQDFWASMRPRKRANGDTSYAVLYRLDGGQRTLTFRDERQAEAFKSAIKAHGIHRALSMHGYEVARSEESSTPPVTVAQWCRHHNAHLTGVEQYTLDTYDRYLRLDIEPSLGDIPLARLTEEHRHLGQAHGDHQVDQDRPRAECQDVEESARLSVRCPGCCGEQGLDSGQSGCGSAVAKGYHRSRR